MAVLHQHGAVILIKTALIAILATLGLAWVLVATEPGLQALVWLIHRSTTSWTLQGVQGTLTHLSVDRMQWTHSSGHGEMTGLALAWSWPEALQGVYHIRKLHIESLRYRSNPTDDPAPMAIALPKWRDWQIDDGRIERWYVSSDEQALRLELNWQVDRGGQVKITDQDTVVGLIDCHPLAQGHRLQLQAHLAAHSELRQHMALPEGEYRLSGQAVWLMDPDGLEQVQLRCSLPGAQADLTGHMRSMQGAWRLQLQPGTWSMLSQWLPWLEPLASLQGEMTWQSNGTQHRMEAQLALTPGITTDQEHQLQAQIHWQPTGAHAQVSVRDQHHTWLSWQVTPEQQLYPWQLSVKLEPLLWFVRLPDQTLQGQVSGQGVCSSTFTPLSGQIQWHGSYWHGLTHTHLQNIDAAVRYQQKTGWQMKLQASDGRSGLLRVATVEPHTLSWHVDAFRWAQSPRLSSEISGQGQLRWSAADGPLLSGAIQHKKTVIDLPGWLTSADETGLEPIDDQPTWDLTGIEQFRVNLPNQMVIKGFGLFAEMGGTIEIKQGIGSGQLKLIQGRYQLLGRVFELTEGRCYVDRGHLFFNFTAQLTLDSTEIQVILRGTRHHLDIQLQSQPMMSEQDVLSWIVFGQKSQQLSVVQALRLAKLMYEWRSPSGTSRFNQIEQLQSLLDLNDLRVGQSEGHWQVGVGKYIGDDIYVDLEQELAGDDAKTKLSVAINQRLTFDAVRARDPVNSKIQIGIRHRY